MPEIKYTAVNKAAEQAARELINILHRHIAGVNAAYSTYHVEKDKNKGLYTEAALAAQAAQAQESGRRAVAWTLPKRFLPASKRLFCLVL